ncbi:hypothetical protein SAMN02927903_03359 [Flavobacterium caeni]|uniref:Uncharacterized protein n=1 Tax=Flavobacterium caeni TaxID=490189 RepID=A0A1G5KLW2_9FLAO|nr:hypothetical protein SAMN02927903_03359 [Flavobacterium caeni]
MRKYSGRSSTFTYRKNKRAYKFLITAQLSKSWFFVGWTFGFHEESLILAESTQFAFPLLRNCAKRYTPV